MSYVKTYHRDDYTCRSMFAFDAVSLLLDVMAVLPTDEMEVMASELGRKAMRNDPSALGYLSGKNKFTDEVFLGEIFGASGLRYQDKAIDIKTHFEDIFDLFDVLSWIIECNYSLFFSRKVLEIPDMIQNADKILKQKRGIGPFQKEDQKNQFASSLAEGVPPVNINPWIFSVIASTDKNKRVDWPLLDKLKKEYTLNEFLDIWECVESAKSYEAAALINSA